MKQKDSFLKNTLFKHFAICYILLVALVLLKPSNGFGQNTVLIGNITLAGSPAPSGAEPLYLGSNEIGCIVKTGSKATILNSFKIKLWNSQGMGFSSFNLRVRQVDANPPVNFGDPVTYTIISTKYTNAVSQIIDNNILNLESSSNTLSIFPTVTLDANSSYFVSIQNSSTQSVYWLQSDTALPDYKMSNWANLGAYTYFAGGFTPIPTANKTLFYELLGGLPNASVSTKNVTDVVHEQTIFATSGGTALAEVGSSISAKGICWSTSTNPTIADSFTNEGTGTADYTSTLTNLLPNTKYYVRAYVTDASGTYYGAETTFSTNQAPQIISGDGLSNVSLSAPENTPFGTTITATDADVPAQNLTFSITGGADASKFSINSTTGVLSLNATPDFETPTDADANNSYLVEINVADNGDFVKNATQSITVTITNVAENPIVNNATTTSVGITGALVNATVVSDGGGGTMTEIGFVYAPTSANAHPSIGGVGTTKVTVSGSIGSMSKLLTGLTSNTAYTVKAFATNATGTTYTDTFSFTTNTVTAGPSISYNTPFYFERNIAIAAVSPNNVGTTIPAGTYSKVTKFAGSTDGNANTTDPLTAKFNAPMGMVMDASRNFYFCDSYNHRIKKIDGATGAVTQIAGQTTPTPFLASDSGSNDGTGNGNARFNQPSGMTYDPSGILYVADRENNKIRKLVLATGAVSTIAGGGSGSQTGYIDAAGTAARFSKPTDLVFRTENGTSFLYVADAGNHCIRKINLTTNAVTTYAGTNSSGTTEGALATARFNNPTSLAFSSTGILYVVDRGNQKIRKIENSIVSTLAGSGTNASTNGTAGAAAFADPYGIAIDGGDNVYVTQALDGGYPSTNPGFAISNSTNNYIRKITPSGVVTTFIGTGAKDTTDNTNGLLATLSSPAHLLFDTNQKNMYVSEWFGDDIRKVDITGYTVSPALPTGLAFDATTGTISGTPIVLKSATDYAVTGYNYYGSSATSLNVTVANLPSITTTPATLMTSTAAVSGGNVTNNGGLSLLEKGICWSTTTNPTTATTKIVDGTITTGVFTSNITGLTPETAYYVKAYATTILGTVYGTEISFTTPVPSPSITYNATNTFTVNTLIAPLQVTNTGGNVSGLKDVVSSLAGSTVAGFVDGTASDARFNYPTNVAIDKNGNVYVADYINKVIRKITPSGIVSTFAGNGSSGSTDGNGSNARFALPTGITIDANGNLYVADSGNFLIRKIDAAGNVTTVAGVAFNSLYFSHPKGIAIDSAGNLFVADYSNHRIRKIDGATGVITTIAGSGIAGSANGSGTDASFNFPTGITIDTTGNLYVTESNNGGRSIRKITPAGLVTTVAGGSGSGFTDGTGTLATFVNPVGICFDLAGNLIIADNAKFRKVTTEGVVTTISNGQYQRLTNGPLISAEFTNLGGITRDAAGNIYVADTGNNTIRKISGTGYSIAPALPAGLVLNTDGSISGTPTALSPATDYTITATNAGGSSSYITKITVLGVPTITTSVTANTITSSGVSIKGDVTSSGGTTTFLSKGICYATTSSPTIADTVLNAAENSTSSFSVGLTGLLPSTTYYVRAFAENSVGIAYGNEIIFTTKTQLPNISYNEFNVFTTGNAINPLPVTNTGGAVTGLSFAAVSTLAGSIEGYANGVGTAAKFTFPKGIVFDTDGNAFVTEGKAIRKITPAGVVSTFAGGETSGNADGIGSEAKFNVPFDIAIDGNNVLYVTDYNNNNIRKIDRDGYVTTVSLAGLPLSFNRPTGILIGATGNLYVCESGASKITIVNVNGNKTLLAGGTSGTADGTGANAQFVSPIDITLTGGNFYVTEASSSLIRKITPEGVVTTIAGTLPVGQIVSTGSSDNTIGTLATFNEPRGICSDPAGNLVIADAGNNRIRMVGADSYSVTTLFGSSVGYVDGPIDSGRFTDPRGVAFDANGNFYIVDTGNNAIRKIAATGYSVRPALPAGLVLNEDGSISGTPTAFSFPTEYTITATNAGGRSSFVVTIAVDEPRSEWTGATDTNWNEATNWEPAVVPDVTLGVYIPNTINQPVSSGNITVKALILDANASLTIAPNDVLKVNNYITNNGQIIFKSNGSGSAIFDQYSGSINGTGTVTVERYIPAKRAYRFLSSSVSTDTSIKENWQEAGTSVAGLGTHITGIGGAANGFDATASNNPSLFTYTNGAWEPNTSTDLSPLNAGQAYRLMVRGDRTIDLSTNTPIATPTVLRATGRLRTGSSTPDLNQASEGYSFIGNPFQAPIDIKAVLNAATNMNTDVMYYWDPTKNSRGAYVTRTLGSINQNSITSDFNEILQPGQAVFVKKANTTNLANMLFTESHKVIANAAAGAFKNSQKSANTYGLLRVNLQANQNNNWETIEGALAIFDDKYSWEVTDEDAAKMANLDEEVSFIQSNTALAIACQAMPIVTNELPIKINNTRHVNYQWQFELTNYNGETPYLLDTQNNTTIKIENGTIAPFTADTNVSNRYKIVFQNKTLSTPDFNNEIVFYPNPGKPGSSFYLQGIIEAEVTLYTVLGQKITVQTVANGNTLQVTPVSKVSQGVYFVNVQQAGKTTQLKWIVE